MSKLPPFIVQDRMKSLLATQRKAFNGLERKKVTLANKFIKQAKRLQAQCPHAATELGVSEDNLGLPLCSHCGKSLEEAGS